MGRLGEEVDEQRRAGHLLAKAALFDGKAFIAQAVAQRLIHPGAGGERDGEIHIERIRREAARARAAQVARHEATDEDEVFVKIGEPRPDGEERGLGADRVIRPVAGVVGMFHGWQKPSHARSARAASGPRSPAWSRSR